MRVKIISPGTPSVSPIERVGKYVNPEVWNELIRDPDTIVLMSEFLGLGSFIGAVDPCMTGFLNSTTVVMYCTGGSRCE